MQISLKWLNSLLTITSFQKINYKNLTSYLLNSNFNLNLLTLTGFEVEKIIPDSNHNDIILEVDTTPNRFDVSSIVGFSNEVSNLMNISKRKNNAYYPKQIEQQHQIFENKNLASTYFYYTEIHNIQIKSSPNWIKKRLKQNNIEPENNFTDLTKYCLLEWGQPINFYDLDSIKKLNPTQNIKINIKTNCNNSELVNEISGDQHKSNLFLTNNREALNLLGIKELERIKITKKTKSILLEGGIYPQSLIRQLMRQNGLTTQTGLQLAKGTSPLFLKYTIQRILKLISLDQQQPNVKIYTNQWLQKTQKQVKEIELNSNLIKNVLGEIKTKNSIKSLSNKEISRALNQLKLQTKSNNNIFKVAAPLFREKDITEAVDIIEEIGRVYGFNKFNSRLPLVKITGLETRESKLINTIRKILISHGFNETINYSILGKHQNYLSQEEKILNIKNPLGIGENLRTSLIPYLLNVYEYNNNQNNPRLNIFEIGRIFNKKERCETTFLGGILGYTNNQINWKEKPQPINWEFAKSKFCLFLNELELPYSWTKINKNINTSLLHNTRTAKLQINGITIGIFSQINPKYAQTKNIKNELYLFELNLTLIAQIKNYKEKIFKPYSIYPTIEYDITHKLPNKLKITKAINQYKNLINKYLKKDSNLEIKIKVKTIFQLEEELDSNYVTFNFKFRNKKKTLLKIEIEKIVNNLENNFNKQILTLQ